MPWYLVVAVIALFSCGWLFNAWAVANPRSPDEAVQRRLFVLGGFASAKLFSRRGWKFRKLAFLFHILALLVVLVWALLTQ